MGSILVVAALEWVSAEGQPTEDLARRWETEFPGDLSVRHMRSILSLLCLFVLLALDMGH